MTLKELREHRQYPEQTKSDASRAVYERDYSRLIHSPTFRRCKENHRYSVPAPAIITGRA